MIISLQPAFMDCMIGVVNPANSVEQTANATATTHPPACRRGRNPMIEIALTCLVLGFALGWACGTTAEHKLWLDAVCGREKLIRGNGKEPPK